jgi:septal ring factor EnvC (AmiA/AmiB activator)
MIKPKMKRILKQALQPEANTEPTKHEEIEVKVSLVKKYENILKVSAGILGSIGVIYTSAWAVGLAPVTNSKAVEVVEERIHQHEIQITQNFKDEFKSQDDKLKALEGSVKTLSDQSVRTDERTKTIIDEQKQQRDDIKQILRGVQSIQK